MSLDLLQVTPQIEMMSSQLRERQAVWNSKLINANSLLHSANSTELEEKRKLSGRTLTWLVPTVLDELTSKIPCPTLEDEHAVLAVDGSHIDIDRHSPVRCYLLNYGKVALRYGEKYEARLSNTAYLNAKDEDLVIGDPSSGLRAERIEGAVLGLKRSIEEVESLASLLENSWNDIPTVGLIDGTLVLWSLTGERYRGFIKQALLDNGLLPALDRIRDLSKKNKVAMASYISLPGSAEVVNVLRLHECPYQVANCEQFCGQTQSGSLPCGSLDGLRDRDLMMTLLEPGNRSAVFASTSVAVEASYREHAVYFFYVHVGDEIGRVEIPKWVAESEELLELVHAVIIDQCSKGLGYPVALSEAHEQAVVTWQDREQFQKLVESSLHQNHLPVYVSEKQRSKQLKAL